MFHPSFYPQPPTQPSRVNPMNFFNPSQAFFPGPSAVPTFNRSTHNLNFTHDFEHFQMPAHGFTSMPAGGMPFRIFDFNRPNPSPVDSQRQNQRWRQNMARMQQQQQQQQQQQKKHRRTPAFHFQDHSTSYFMTEPIRTSDDRIAIQLTKVHIGPNGDQQRVFVEQEFSNEQEYNAFVRNFRHNLEKAFKHHTAHGTHQTDQNDENQSDSKTAGVVVVEEPDEEPKIYQQQAYNAKIESRKAAAAAAAAAASMMTPPLTPTSSRSPTPNPSNPAHIEHQAPTPGRARTTRRTRYTSPAAAATRMSSSSTTRSYRRRRRNKMKYRRQQAEQQRDNLPNSFQAPHYPPRYPVTPPPSMHFQPRFFAHEPDANLNKGVPQFQWRFQRPVPPYPRPPSSPPGRFRHSQTPRNQSRPATVADHHRYPNHDQQQPRVHRAKSECQSSRNFQAQRTRSTVNQFQQFSPIQQSPIVHRHFVPFCSAPFLSTAPNIFTNQRRQMSANGQVHLGLFNSYRLGSTRF